MFGGLDIAVMALGIACGVVGVAAARAFVKSDGKKRNENKKSHGRGTQTSQ